MAETVTEMYNVKDDGKHQELVGREVVSAPDPVTSSVEFTVDSKGLLKPTVKVHHSDPYEAYRIALELMTRAMQVVINAVSPKPATTEAKAGTKT